MIQLGKQRFRKKWNVTGEINMPTWWRLPEAVRWQHTARNYEKSYDAWTAEFTFDTRKYSGQWLVDYINAEILKHWYWTWAVVAILTKAKSKTSLALNLAHGVTAI